jgi:two-component system NtrC family sensor kinase
MRFQLEQSGKLAAIGELAAGVAHEINNPIATLDVQTGLMRDILRDEQAKLRGKFFEEIDEYLDIVHSQVQRCQSVTEDLLSFSRSPRFRAESCEINSLLEKTVRLVSSLTDKKPNLQLQLDERLPTFLGDPSRLEQVFVNLLNNALKAIESGGSITVTTRATENNDICVDFKDTGPGMDPEIGARIFDPFFTTDPAGGGTGLGLSISYYIVKEMNGTIAMESNPGEGATFTVTLPDPGQANGNIGNA